MIELMAVRSKRRWQVVNGAEVFLDLADALANRDLPTQSRLDELSRRKMIGMRVSFENPIQVQTVLFDVGDYFLSRCVIGLARYGREAEHRIDYLDAPVLRVGAKPIPIPYSPAMEQHVLPGPSDIVAALSAAVR